MPMWLNPTSTRRTPCATSRSFGSDEYGGNRYTLKSLRFWAEENGKAKVNEPGFKRCEAWYKEGSGRTMKTRCIFLGALLELTVCSR